MQQAVPRPAAAASPAATTATRRAADIAVLGNSLQAYAAAYLLAKRGKRTVLIEHAEPQLAAASGSRARPDVVLHLPATTAHRVNAAIESLALWRGIEAATNAKSLLQLCGSIDVAPLRGSSAASDVLGMMQDASKAAGLSFGVLSPDEVGAAFSQLRLGSGTAGLYTPLGGVVNGSVAAAALLAMARRGGAEVAPAGRCLLGWRDAGGHFALRTSAAAAAGTAAAGDEVIFECEQLVLLPEAAVQQATLALFGMAVPGAELWQVAAARWQAQQECASVPLWQLLSTGSTQGVDDPAAVDSCWGLPVLDWASGSTLVAHSLADGQQVEQRQSGRQDAAVGGASSNSSTGSGSSSGSGAAPGGTQALQQQAAADPVLAAAAAAAAGSDELRPGSEEAVDAERQRQAAQQQQAQQQQRRLDAVGALSSRLVRGIGHRLAGSDSWRQYVVTPDGEPAAGSHPGYEQGRVVASFPATSAALGCLPGDQLAPLVARLAVSELLGQAPEAVEAAAVALSREALGAEATALQYDSWGELGSGLLL